MTCSGELTISLFGMLFFVGFAIGSVILPSLSDKKGRKLLFACCLLTSVITSVIMIFLPGGSQNYNMVYVIMALFFVNGVQTGGRQACGFCYFCELAPSRYADLMGSFWNVSEGSVYIWITLYYRYLSKEWKWTVVFAAVEAFLSVVVVILILPESPKWLYKEKRYEECQKAL
jgi:MFS family permease